MPMDELVERLHRIYAALDETMEGDLSKFPPKVIGDEHGFMAYQDFLGGLNPAQLSNLAYGAVHNIATLHDHLKRWAAKNGRDPNVVDRVVAASPALQIVKDLWNNDKHGYPPRGVSHSGKAPKLAEVRRVLRLSTGAKAGSFVGVFLKPEGLKQVGDGSSAVVITGQVVDSTGAVIGDLYNICLEAVASWEQALKALGVIT